jgi:hypothetical protein
LRYINLLTSFCWFVPLQKATALMEASSLGQKEMVDLLLKAGADVLAKDDNVSFTAFAYRFCSLPLLIHPFFPLRPFFRLFLFRVGLL